MIQSLKMSRKALTMGVVLTTLAWSMMATVLVAPFQASAAGCTGGTLIKGSLSAVYYCGSDGKRYVFPNEKTYKSWYSDFSGVVTITDANLATLQIGGNVTYRPGVKMVKITTDPKVYAVSKGGVLRPVASEAVASSLYGSTWNKQIDDVSDAFFTNYTIGSAVNSGSDFDKAAQMSADQSINVDKNLGNVSGTGTIMASLASDSPASMTIPAGATSVNFLKFNVRNTGASDMTVNGLTVQRVGPGATSDISQVYLYNGASRLTTGRTVNSSTNQANFTGLGLTIASGATQTLWVAVDVAAVPTAGSVHAFEVTSIDAGAASVGGLPVLGNNMSFTTAAVGSLTVTKTGSIANPNVGAKGVQIADFQVNAGTSEDVWLNRITLFQGGNLAAANLTNLKLMNAGVVVATAASLDSKLHVTFNLATPMSIQKGATKEFTVWADIGGAARAADTIALYVEQSSDVYATGSTFGFGVTVTTNGTSGYDGTSCTSVSGKCSFSTVQGGQVTINFNGPSSQNFASNTKGADLFDISMSAQSNVEVRKMTLTIACGPTSSAGGCKNDSTSLPNYTNIKVVNTATGQTWWGPQDLSGTGSDSSQNVVFNDVQSLVAGTVYTFRVVSDISTTVPNNDTVTPTLVAFGSSDLRNLDNNTFIDPTTVVPAGNIQGNQHTVLAPSLTVSLASTPVSQSYVKGSSAVPFVAANLKAGDGSAVTVASVTFTGFIDGSGVGAFTQGQSPTTSTVKVADDVLTCKLMDGSTQLGTAKAPTTSTAAGNGGLLQFNNLTYSVPASATKTLTVVCDTSNSAFQGGDAERISFSLANADVTAQDPSGNSLVAGTTITGSANGTTSPSTAVTITNTGTLTVQLAPNDTESQDGLVVAGSQSAVLGKWRFTSSNEDLNVDKLSFYMDAATSTAGRDITSLSLYDDSTAQLLAGPVSLTNTSASATALFSGMTFIVPKNGSKTVSLKAALNTVSNGAVSGDNLKARIFIPGALTVAGTPNTTNTSAFEARGTSSSTVIRNFTGATDTNTAGNSKIIRKTIPTISLASLPSTVASNGGGTVLYRFTVTADQAENVSLKKLAFQVGINDTNVNATVSLAAVREVGQGSDISASSSVQVNQSSCGFTATNTTLCVTIAFTSEQVISHGSSKTFELRATTAGFDVAGESLSTKILGDSTADGGQLNSVLGPTLGVNVTNYNFIWSDNAAIPHNDTVGGGSTDWTNGNLVKVLPGDAQTLSR